MQSLLVLLLLAAPPAKPAKPTAAVTGRAARPIQPPKPPPPFCAGAYADDFDALSKAAVEQASKVDGQFTSCVRTTATFECLSYAGDGSIKRTRKEATAHGTAFAFKRQGGETLLLTNAHVVEYPPVTDEEKPVSGVPAGCKRVADVLRIVDNEKDTFEGDDIPLTRVVVDPALDMAVVKTKAPLAVLPWKVGRSSALRERNVVEVRGFPLGAFKATVQGRVTSAYDHDDYQDWDHDDFVVDAQLSTGNSGSPVLAVSCATGEYELVGVFHADYSRGKSLNVVVHVDQLRELMTTLKRSTPAHADSAPLAAPARKRLQDATAELGQLFFPLGTLTASVRLREDGALLYSVYPRDFPASSWPVAVLEDLDTSEEGGFGTPSRAWFGNARGLTEPALDGLEATERLSIERAFDSARRAALLTTALRAARARAESSREAAEDVGRLEKEQRRLTGRSRDLGQALLELAERLAPTPGTAAIPPGRPFIHAAPAEPGTSLAPAATTP